MHTMSDANDEMSDYGRARVEEPFSTAAQTKGLVSVDMRRRGWAAIGSTALVVATALAQPPASANRNAEIGGELRQWHKITLTLDGPQADERASDPNPFRDYRMTVRFAHESGAPAYTVPGYFAADGNAANTSATTGSKWRAHLSPDKPGRWDWRVNFVRGKDAAIDAVAAARAEPVAPVDGLSGSFQIVATNKTAPDFRARGRLEYVGGHCLRFAGTGARAQRAPSSTSAARTMCQWP
jgi:hypothetical protein